jgi:glycosyltransferase involved in cell wall biosynthesis
MLEVLKGYGVNSPAEIIPTGIHPEKFSIGEGSVFRKKYSIDKDRPVMLYLGRVAHEKNIDFLLHVLVEVKKRVDNVLMIVAGDGPAVGDLKALSTELNLNENILFIGYLSREHELPDCYAAANVFVFASRTETQGLVLLEAMAAGTAVVSTAVMGTAAVLKDNEGALISDENVSIFSKKVMRVLKNPETEWLLSKSAQQYAYKWSVEELTNRLCLLYKTVIDENCALLTCDLMLQDMDT